MRSQLACSQGPICLKKSRGVVNVNRTVAKPKGTLEIGVIKGSMAWVPTSPTPRQIGHWKPPIWESRFFKPPRMINAATARCERTILLTAVRNVRNVGTNFPVTPN